MNEERVRKIAEIIHPEYFMKVEGGTNYSTMSIFQQYAIAKAQAILLEIENDNVES